MKFRSFLVATLFLPLLVQAQALSRDQIKNLWSLATQEAAITLPQLKNALHLDLERYEDKPKFGWEHSLAIINKASDDANENQPIRFIEISKVSAAVSNNGQQRLPITQGMRVYFGRNTCLSILDISKAIGIPAQRKLHGSPHGAPYPVFAFIPSEHPIKSIMELSEECAHSINITKTFSNTYWNKICEFSYNQNVADNIIRPALEVKFGDQYKEVDYQIPYNMIEYDRTVLLTFRRSSLDSTNHVTRSEVHMDMNRCDLHIIKMFEIPSTPR